MLWLHGFLPCAPAQLEKGRTQHGRSTPSLKCQQKQIYSREDLPFTTQESGRNHCFNITNVWSLDSSSHLHALSLQLTCLLAKGPVYHKALSARYSTTAKQRVGFFPQNTCSHKMITHSSWVLYTYKETEQKVMTGMLSRTLLVIFICSTGHRFLCWSIHSKSIMRVWFRSHFPTKKVQ